MNEIREKNPPRFKVIAISLLCLTSLAQGKPPPLFPYKTESPPVIDGTLVRSCLRRCNMMEWRGEPAAQRQANTQQGAPAYCMVASGPTSSF